MSGTSKGRNHHALSPLPQWPLPPFQAPLLERLRHQRDWRAPLALPGLRAALFRLGGGLVILGLRALPPLR